MTRASLEENGFGKTILWFRTLHFTGKNVCKEKNVLYGMKKRNLGPKGAIVNVKKLNKWRIKLCDYFDFETHFFFAFKIVINLSGDCQDLGFNTRLQRLSGNDVNDLVQLHIPPRVNITQHKAVTEKEKKKSKFMVKLSQKQEGKNKISRMCPRFPKSLYHKRRNIHQLSEATDDLS